MVRVSVLSLLGIVVFTALVSNNGVAATAPTNCNLNTIKTACQSIANGNNPAGTFIDLKVWLDGLNDLISNNAGGSANGLLLVTAVVNLTNNACTDQSGGTNTIVDASVFVQLIVQLVLGLQGNPVISINALITLLTNLCGSANNGLALININLLASLLAQVTASVTVDVDLLISLLAGITASGTVVVSATLSAIVNQACNSNAGVTVDIDIVVNLLTGLLGGQGSGPICAANVINNCIARTKPCTGLLGPLLCNVIGIVTGLLGVILG